MTRRIERFRDARRLNQALNVSFANAGSWRCAIAHAHSYQGPAQPSVWRSVYAASRNPLLRRRRRQRYWGGTRGAVQLLGSLHSAESQHRKQRRSSHCQFAAGRPVSSRVDRGWRWGQPGPRASQPGLARLHQPPARGIQSATRVPAGRRPDPAIADLAAHP